MTKTCLIALGGNALSPKGEAGTIAEQFLHTRESMVEIMEFVRRGYNICLTHGNGPQVGHELLRMDLTHNTVPPLPLGVCVAGTQGTIGYMIQQSLQNALRDEKVDREVVTLVTQVRVHEDDPSIFNPTKYIGNRYPKKEAEALAKKFGWTIKEQEPGQWRRVVPSPDPEYVMHGISIRTLVEKGTIVLAAGGGGIPVYNDKDHKLEGLDAVIDKDLTAAKLGWVIRAREYYIITDIDQVYLHFKTQQQEPILQMTATEAKQYEEKGHFQKGSMGPKIRSAVHFLKHGGSKAVITNIQNITKAMNNQAGTTIFPENLPTA
ncbi:MAG TPA: carbamate kinase [Candidatus Marinimicrobia bacterium]|jgi:carbamate kinase|nr:carbamate kinase [Candidatus Neomarinimicrobiota bacterium]|tara:strand:+ start:449 stop:1408 length:960 start_codon:yes stop_codon:yes gene_type:complete